MADNNFLETNSQGDNRLPSNPYASNNGLIPKMSKIDYCNYLASFSYVVASGGATLTATPLTGHLGTDLNHYRVEVVDTHGTVATGSLSLAARTTPFIVDTSVLDVNTSWTMLFYGSENSSSGGDVPCGLQYKKVLGVIGTTGGSGTTVPSPWVNVSFLIKLAATDDGNYNNFPSEGVEVVDGGSIDLTSYSDVGEFSASTNTLFTVQMKRIGYGPQIAAAPTQSTGDVYSAFTDANSYPYAISLQYSDVLTSLTADTTAPGSFTDVLTFAIVGEAVKPSVSFTSTSVVGA